MDGSKEQKKAEIRIAEKKVKSAKKIRIIKFWKYSIFWVILLILQLGLLYGVSYWGYHNSRTPYWFDNWVQKTGVWKMYGKRDVVFNFEDFSLNNEKVALKERVVEKVYFGFTTAVSDEYVEISYSASDSKMIKFNGNVKVFHCNQSIVSYATVTEKVKFFRSGGCEELNGYDADLLKGKFLIVSESRNFDTEDSWVNIYYGDQND